MRIVVKAYVAHIRVPVQAVRFVLHVVVLIVRVVVIRRHLHAVFCEFLRNPVANLLTDLLRERLPAHRTELFAQRLHGFLRARKHRVVLVAVDRLSVVCHGIQRCIDVAREPLAVDADKAGDRAVQKLGCAALVVQVDRGKYFPNDRVFVVFQMFRVRFRVLGGVFIFRGDKDLLTDMARGAAPGIHNTLVRSLRHAALDKLKFVHSVRDGVERHDTVIAVRSDVTEDLVADLSVRRNN